jgi:hypothetical protein
MVGYLLTRGVRAQAEERSPAAVPE